MPARLYFNLTPEVEERLRTVAAKLGITYERALREFNNAVYRKAYRVAYNHRDYVKAKRREANRVSYGIRKAVVASLR